MTQSHSASSSNGHANGRLGHLPTPEEIAARAAEERERRPAGFKIADPKAAARTFRKASEVSDQEILEAIGDETLQGKEIAKRLGLDPDCSENRRRLSRLKQVGCLDHVKDEGYRVTGKPIEEARVGPVVIDLDQLARQLRGLRLVLEELDGLRDLLTEKKSQDDPVLSDDDEWAILRALADAGEPLQSQELARALGLDPECSTPRVKLSRNKALRAGGYVVHIPSKGYAITEKGRRTLKEGQP